MLVGMICKAAFLFKILQYRLKIILTLSKLSLAFGFDVFQSFLLGWDDLNHGIGECNAVEYIE